MARFEIETKDYDTFLLWRVTDTAHSPPKLVSTHSEENQAKKAAAKCESSAASNYQLSLIAGRWTVRNGETVVSVHHTERDAIASMKEYEK